MNSAPSAQSTTGLLESGGASSRNGDAPESAAGAAGAAATVFTAESARSRSPAGSTPANGSSPPNGNRNHSHDLTSSEAINAIAGGAPLALATVPGDGAPPQTRMGAVGHDRSCARSFIELFYCTRARVSMNLSCTGIQRTRACSSKRKYVAISIRASARSVAGVKFCSWSKRRS